MKRFIKFYFPEETLHYHIKQSFGKVVFQNKKNVLVVEIKSNDELDHVEGDSLQNEYPEIVLNIDDFPIDFESLEELVKQEVSIKNSYEEFENEDEEIIEYFYTNLNVNDEMDLETNNNTLSFFKNETGIICLNWKGECEHFENEDELIKFEVETEVDFKQIQKDYDE